MNAELRKAVETAVQMEQDSISFYTSAAARTTDPSGKLMYESLVKDEQRHLAVLKRIIAEKVLPESLAEVFPERGESLQRSIRTAFAEAQQQVDERVSADSNDIAAIREAIDLENEGLRFYGKLAAQADDDVAKAVYRRLQQEEDEHLNFLINTLDYMEDNGDWFLWDEQGLLDGG